MHQTYAHTHFIRVRLSMANEYFVVLCFRLIWWTIFSRSPQFGVRFVRAFFWCLSLLSSPSILQIICILCCSNVKIHTEPHIRMHTLTITYTKDCFYLFRIHCAHIFCRYGLTASWRFDRFISLSNSHCLTLDDRNFKLVYIFCFFFVFLSLSRCLWTGFLCILFFCWRCSLFQIHTRKWRRGSKRWLQFNTQ